MILKRFVFKYSSIQKDDIRQFKNDSVIVDALGYAQSISNEIKNKLKFNALVEKSRKIDIYGKKFKSDGVSRSLKERNEQIKEEVYLFVVDFNNPYFDDDEDDFIKDAYDYEELRKQYEKNLLKSGYLQDKFLQIIADIHDNFINDIKSDITKNFGKNMIDEDKMNKNITLNSTTDEFERLIRPIYNQECPFISKEMEEEIFNLVQLNDPYAIFSMVIKEDIVFLSGIGGEYKTLIKKILKLHDNIREKLGEKNG